MDGKRVRLLDDAVEVGGQVARWQHWLAPFISLQLQRLCAFVHFLERLVPENLFILVAILEVGSLSFNLGRLCLIRHLRPVRAHFEGLRLYLLELLIVDLERCIILLRAAAVHIHGIRLSSLALGSVHYVVALLVLDGLLSNLLGCHAHDLGQALALGLPRTRLAVLKLVHKLKLAVLELRPTLALLLHGLPRVK